MSFEEDLKLIAAAKKSINDESKDISYKKIRDINLISNDISAGGINEEILDEVDYYILKHINRELDENSDLIVRELINNHEEIQNNYKDYLKLKTLFAETYSAKVQEPIPDKIKNLLNSKPDRRPFKIFSVAGLGSLAALGWLGTLSLGTIQILGIMATTTVPTAVMRGGPVEDEIDFEILDINDDCVTFIYELPDQSSSITKNICLELE